MPELVHLLEELFNLHGHRVTRDAALEGRSGTVYTVPLLAEGHTTLLVTGHFDGTVLTATDVTEFLTTVDDTGADLGVLCHAGATTPEAVAIAGSRILLWGRDQMVRLLGEMQLAQCLDESPPMLPLRPAQAASESLAESVSDLMPAAFRVAEVVAEEDLSGLLPSIQLDPEPSSLPSYYPPPVAPNVSAVPASVVPVAPEPVEEPFLPQIAPLEEDPFKPFPQLATPAMLPDPSPMPIEIPQLPGIQSLAPPSAPVAQAPFLSPLAARVHSLAPLIAAAAANSIPTATYAPLTGAPARASHGSPSSGYGTATQTRMMAPAPMPAGPVAATVRPQSRPMLPVCITVEEARRRVKDKLFSVDHVELILHPIHLFDYECDVLKEGSLQFDTLDGRLQVHGSDKSTLDVDPDQANPEGQTLLPPNHSYATTERVLRIPADRAMQLATTHVMAKHTRNVDVRVPDHNNSLFYTEKRKVQPTPDQVRVTALGIYFRPAWRLHGSNGQLDLDAVDGRELFAELRNGRTDAMIVD